MSYPTGILECLVRIGIGDSFRGSGVLFGRETVLTCAHVIIPPDDVKNLAREPDFSEHGGTAAFFKKFEGVEGLHGQTVFDITLFNGTVARATRHAVHDNEDLVLLRLKSPLDYAVFPPPFGHWAATHAGASEAHAAYGFRLRGPAAFDIQSNAVDPVVRTDIDLGSQSTMFFGNATQGMSGGPVVERTEKTFNLIGITSLGRMGVPHGRIIRAEILNKFLTQYASDETVRDYGARGQQFGAAPVLEGHQSKLTAAWRWIRQTGASELRRLPDLSIDYIASRPLLMSEIDAVWSRPRSRALTAARSRCFAELTAAEAKATIEKLSSQSGLSIRFPEGGKPFGTFGSVKRRALPIEYDGLSVGADGLAVLPEDVAEWRSSDGLDETRRFFPGDPAAYDENRVHFSMSDTRALLRPQLSLPVWRDA